MKVTLEEAKEIIKRLEEQDKSIKIDITCPDGNASIIMCDTLNELRSRMKH